MLEDLLVVIKFSLLLSELKMMPLSIIITIVILSIIFIIIAGIFAYQAHIKKPSPAGFEFGDELAVSMEDFNSGTYGKVKVKGEIWKAISNENIIKDDFLKIISVNRFVLKVEKINQQNIH